MEPAEVGYYLHKLIDTCIIYLHGLLRKAKGQMTCLWCCSWGLSQTPVLSYNSSVGNGIPRKFFRSPHCAPLSFKDPSTDPGCTRSPFPRRGRGDVCFWYFLLKTGALLVWGHANQVFPVHLGMSCDSGLCRPSTG